jgi:hypothetical protein
VREITGVSLLNASCGGLASFNRANDAAGMQDAPPRGEKKPAA